MYDTASLADDLRRLGVSPGGVVLVHSGFRSFGPVEGGPDAVAQALLSAAGSGGTILAPTFTTNLVDPYTWPVPPSPKERERLLQSIPYFDPELSPPHKMGAVARALWRMAGARRSRHPVTSWVALGPRAEALTANHPLDDPEGIDGPVGRAYRADASVLLLGVDHDANTTIHLAESLLQMPHLTLLPDRFPVQGPDGARTWRAIQKTTKCSDGFIRLDRHLERAGVIRRGRVGDAPSQLLRSRDVVRVTVELLMRQPDALLCDDVECVHCPTSRRALIGFAADPPPLLP